MAGSKYLLKQSSIEDEKGFKNSPSGGLNLVRESFNGVPKHSKAQNNSLQPIVKQSKNAAGGIQDLDSNGGLGHILAGLGSTRERSIANTVQNSLPS